VNRALPLALLLSACGAGTLPEPVIRTVTVQVPIDDPRCVREAQARLGPAPDYPDTDAALLAAESVFRGVQLLRAGRVLRIAREAALAEALRACAGGRQ